MLVSNQTRCCVLSLLLISVGCASVKTSSTARTATEQLLVANAVDQSLNKVDFRPFGGHMVYVNDQYVDCIDKNYVISSVRHRILTAGAIIVNDPDKADVLIELRSGAVGTDVAESFLGIPEITLPGVLTLPEVKLLSRNSQKGTAKIGLVAIDTTTKKVLGSGGMSLAQSNTDNWYVMGIGPFKTGSIDYELEQSTTGRAAQVRNWIPATVAFQSPQQHLLEQDATLYASTGTSTEQKSARPAETTPVNFEVPVVPPASDDDTAAISEDQNTPPKTLRKTAPQKRITPRRFQKLPPTAHSSNASDR